MFYLFFACIFGDDSGEYFEGAFGNSAWCFLRNLLNTVSFRGSTFGITFRRASPDVFLGEGSEEGEE